jgi:hypothetical protein
MQENEGLFINLKLPKGFILENFILYELEHLAWIISDKIALSNLRMF